MDCRKHNLVNLYSRYSALLLFTFCCGSFLTLLYIPAEKAVPNVRISIVLIASALILTAAFSTSLCSRGIIPVLSAAFGAVSAYAAYTVCFMLVPDRKSGVCLAAFMLVAVPLHFVIGTEGMAETDFFIGCFGKETGAKKILINMYISVIVAVTVSVLSAGLIVWINK